MKKCFIGVDNGVSGSIGVILEGATPTLVKTPVKKEPSYTKKKQNISRIDCVKLTDVLKDLTQYEVHLLLERPMINPKRWKASMSAIRALEATLIVLEMLKIPYDYIDSKEWQKALLQEGLEGTDELKAASLATGKRLFPMLDFKKFDDADGILLAEWCRRKFGV